MGRIADAILDLEEREHTICKNVVSFLEDRPYLKSADMASKLAVAELFFRATVDQIQSARVSNWGNWGSSIPIPALSLTQGQTIADFFPYPPDTFLVHYTMSLDFFIFLARNSIIIPNLISYDSDRAKHFQSYDSMARGDPDLETKIVWMIESPDHNFRINSIRRRYVLEQIVGDKVEAIHSEYVDENLAAICECFSKFSNKSELLDYVNRTGLAGRYQKIENCSWSLANDLAYVRLLGKAETQNWVRDDVIGRISKCSRLDELGWIKDIVASKAALASRITASFGGRLNINLKQAALLEGNSHGDLQTFTPEMSAFLDFFYNKRRIDSTDAFSQWLDVQAELESVPRNREEYAVFLEENRINISDRERRAAEYFAQSADIDHSIRPEILNTYFDFYDKMVRDVRFFSGAEKAVKLFGQAYIGAATGVTRPAQMVVSAVAGRLGLGKPLESTRSKVWKNVDVAVRRRWDSFNTKFEIVEWL